MTVRSLVALSVSVNIALLLVALRTDPRSVPAAGESTEPAIAAESWRLKTTLRRVKSTETHEPAPFHWSEVHAENLREFVANLRAIGCPPETVRSIIEGELWARFLPRRRLLLEPFHRQYWDLAAAGPDTHKTSESIRESVGKLKEETVGKLDELVGAEVPPPEERSRNRQWDFLSEPKQQEMAELEKSFRSESERVRREQGGKVTVESRANADALEARRKAAIRGLLTPEEYSEYELRQSAHSSIAQSAIGFEATPEEMQAVTRIYQQFDGGEARTSGKDPNSAAAVARTAEIKKQREATLKEVLSPERYAEFQEGSDDRFHQVYRITQRYDLPRDTAAAAARLLKSREEALQRLRAEKGQVERDRMQRELALQSEAREALLGVLGERALQTYEKYHGPVIPASTPGTE